MSLKRQSFKKVSPFPSVFYKDGDINRNLIEKIFQLAARRHKLSIGQFLKLITKFTNIKAKSLTKKKLDIIIDEISEENFRVKWYSKTYRSTKKSDIIPFFNYTYNYVSREYKKLSVNLKENDELFWTYGKPAKNDNGGTSFLTRKGLDKIIDIIEENDIQNDLSAIYIWSFIEAHIWYDFGGNRNENSEALTSYLKKVLKERKLNDILDLILPNDKFLKINTNKNEYDESRIKNFKIKKITKDISEKKEIAEKDIQLEIKEFKEFANSVYELIEMKQKVKRALSEEKYIIVSELSSNIPKIKDLTNKLMSNLQSWAIKNLNEFTFPVKPGNFLEDITVANEYLSSLNGMILKAIKDTEKTIQKRKDILSEKLDFYKIEIPKNFEKIKSEKDLLAFERKYSELILIEKVIVKIGTDSFVEKDLDELGSEARFKVYKKFIYDEYSDKLLERMFNVLLNDPDSFDESEPESFDIFILYFRKMIEKNKELPVGSWRFLYSIKTKNFYEKLNPKELLKNINNLNTIEIEGLETVLEEKDLKYFPPIISNFIKQSKLKTIDPKSRLAKLLELIDEKNVNKSSIGMLCETLACLNRSSEALYLAFIYNKFDSILYSENILHEPLVLLLLTSCEEMNENAVLSELIDDFEWLIKKEDDVVALLYLLYRTKKNDTYINLIYQATEEIESAKRKFPVIMEILTNLNDAALETNHENKGVSENIVLIGKNALFEFKKNLVKLSCYSNWPPAKKYQEYFRDLLQEEYLKLKNGKYLNNLDPDEVIEAAHSKGLPHARGTAIINMRRYLSSQIGNLNKISESLIYVEFNDLRYEEMDIKEQLHQEFEKKAYNNILAYVYKSIMEMQSDS